MPEPGGLARIRQEIDYNFPEWKKLLQNTRFKKLFSKGINTDNILSRPPKGYTDDNPAIAYLKLKSFVVTRPFSDQDVTGKGFLKEVANTFEAAKPMVDFINRSLD